MMRRTRTALIVIAFNNLILTLGFRLWQSIFNNFAVEELGVRADQIGLIQTMREIPGLMGFLVGVLVLVLAEMRIAGLSVVLMGAGIFLTAAARDLPGLIGATLVMSVGFHFFYTSNASAVLLTVGPDEAPKVLGQLNSLGALAAVMGTLFIFGTLDAWGYRTLFRVGGAVVVIGGLALLPFGRQPVRAKRTGRRPPLRRRYWLYHALQFLMGSRRHIFTTFAVTPGLLILLGLFVTDHILFGFSFALQSYFQKIALGPEEITPNISLGQTINHIAAVIVPVAGGVVWETLGAQYTFLAGVAIALLSLALTLRMRTPRPGLTETPSPIR
jgi:predicted MFS family arabinose efflux permease